MNPRRSTWRWVALTAVVVVGLAVLSARVVFRPSGDAHEARPSEVLRWQPPEGWEDFTTVEVGPQGGRVRLDDDIDYRLVAPDVVRRPVELIGGRDVVWLGGHIQIDDQGMVGAEARRGLVVRDDGDEAEGRTVHVEGLLIDGNDVSEGVDIDAPSAVVQLANLRVENVSFRNADDRDGTGAYEEVGDNHPDVVQTYGGFRELRIDGLTATSAYQGLFLKVDADHGRGNTVKLRRVDVEAVSRQGTDHVPYAGNRMFFWDVDTVGDVRVESGTVWVQHHPDAGKVGDVPNPRPGSGSWWHSAYRDGGRLVEDRPPGTASLSDAVEQRRSESNAASRPPAVGDDDVGTYLTWPRHDGRERGELRGLDDDEPGRIYGGRPPSGPFVLREAVGLDYRSPWSEPS